jgi:HSP20 family protein
MKALVRHTQPRNVNLFNDMDRLLNTFFEDLPAGRVGGPSVDVREEDDRYLLEAELPGFNENEVDVKVEDNLLTISSRKEENKEEKNRTYLVRERRSSSFSRSFVLPRDVDSQKINGSFADGVLTLTLEKSPEAKPREIKIRSAG